MSTKTWTSDGFGEEEPYTTLAEGEEDPTKPAAEEPWYSTDAIGEEGPVYSTDAIGEEGDPEPVYDTARVTNPFGAF